MHYHVNRQRTAAGQAAALLIFQILQRLLNTPQGLLMHLAPLMQRAIDRCLADARLRGNLLDREFHDVTKLRSF
ncbi:hypothetical protein D3C71_1604850 [compost metagenome]